MTTDNGLHITELKLGGEDPTTLYYLFVAKQDEKAARTAMEKAIGGKAADYGLTTQEFTVNGVELVGFGLSKDLSHDTLPTDLIQRFAEASHQLPHIDTMGIRESEVRNLRPDYVANLPIQSKIKPVRDQIADAINALDISYPDNGTRPRVKFEGPNIAVDNIRGDDAQGAIVRKLSKHFRAGHDFVIKGSPSGTKEVVIAHAAVMEQLEAGQDTTVRLGWEGRVARIGAQTNSTGPRIA